MGNIKIDLVREDGKSTADNPLTPLAVADELESLADYVENDLPSVSQRAQFCVWRLRDLIPSIAQPNGIEVRREVDGRLRFPIQPGTFDLIELLGKAREICDKLRKQPRPVDSALGDRLRSLATMVRSETAIFELRLGDLQAPKDGKLRRAYHRDHLFLEWHNDDTLPTHRKPATIRDKWNKMSQQQRANVAPHCFATVSADTVDTAIKKARREKK